MCLSFLGGVGFSEYMFWSCRRRTIEFSLFLVDAEGQIKGSCGAVPWGGLLFSVTAKRGGDLRFLFLFYCQMN